MVYLIRGDRRLVGFEITLFNIPGALRTASSVPEKYNLNIEYIETCSKTDEEYLLFMAIDFTESELDPEFIINEFRKHKRYIKEVKIAPALNEIIFPSRFCIKDLGGVRAILLGVAAMRGIVVGIKDKLGKTIGETLLYQIGYETGIEMYRVYSKAGLVKSVEDGVTLIKALARGAGWADLVEYHISETSIKLVFDRLWECEIQRNIVETTASNLARGILGGFFSSLLGKKVHVKEERCIALGAPQCIFRIETQLD